MAMGEGIFRFLQKYHDDERTRALLVVQFNGIAMAVSLFYAVIQPRFHVHVPQWLFLALPAALAVVLVLLARAVLPVKWLAQITVFLFWISFMAGIAYSGGIYSLVMPWLALMPIMAHLLVNHNASKVWLGVVLISAVLFNFFFKDANVLSDGSAPWRSSFSIVGLVTVSYFFTHLYYKATKKNIDQVNAQNIRLLDQQEEIQTQNEELVQQRNEIISQRDFIQRQNDLLSSQNRQIEHVNRELRKRVEEIFQRNSVLERHWHTLLQISKSRAVNFGDFGEAMRYLTQVAADTLQTSRVSVWAINRERNSLQCLVLYDAATRNHREEEDLLLTNFPRYFEALKREGVISAKQAAYNEDTFEFKQSYLEPRHIESMMDAPYFIDGELAGVLCCEQTESARHWTPEDILFAQALADIVTLAYRANQRRDYERRIRLHRREIVRINQSLEDRVRERTRELEAQNNQLAEYAYINSHLLRGPLSRLLGLINLIDYAALADKKEKELIEHLRQSGTELDEVVRKINDAIVERGELNRKTFFDKEKN